jgi:hypothetical protein
MSTEMRTPEKIAPFLLVAQYLLLVVFGVLAILAPTTLLFRVMWWSCVSLGVLAVVFGIRSYFASHGKSSLYICVIALLGLVAATPADLWLFGLGK